jgi:LysR family glycine cleavage system transcriptional activator
MSTRRLPSLQALRIFEASARLGGFTRAATELGLSQSAVSLRMRDLQADLGVALFAATRPRLTLTEAGERLAERVAAGLEVIAEAVDEARRRQPPLRISVNPTFAARWLAPRLGEFTAGVAGSSVELDVGAELKPVGRLGVELAIRSGRGDWPGLEAVRLLPLERTPMMSPALLDDLGESPSVEALRRLPLLYSEHWMAWLEAAGCEASDLTLVPARFPTQDLLAEAAVNGAGVALLSPTLFGPQLARRQLVAPFDLVLSGPDAYFAVYRPGELSTQGRAFLGWLEAMTATSRSGRADQEAPFCAFGSSRLRRRGDPTRT